MNKMGIIDLLKKDITQQELLNYYNTNINYVDLPDGVNGCVFQYKGFHVIYVDKNLSYYKKRKTILHELAHVELGQLEQKDNDLFAFKIDKYEDEADKYLKDILKTVTY
jgi:Zn-dependent peptidase ImmA (M78 family)